MTRPVTIANGSHVKKQRDQVRIKSKVVHEKPNLAKHGLKGK